MHKNIQQQKNNNSTAIKGKYAIKLIQSHNSPQKNKVIGNSKKTNKFQTIR